MFHQFQILALHLILCLGVCVASDSGVEFDGTRAFEILKRQCDFGPRVAGSPASRLCMEFIEKELRQYGLTITRQYFTASSRLQGGVVTGVNIIGLYQGERPTSELLALSAHWDTRPIAERDPNPALRRRPIIGANDGASGVAVLCEIARVLKERRYPGRILFLFFDLEDAGLPGTMEEWCLGSQYFASHSLQDYHITAGINFDMVGDRELNVKPDRLSMEHARKMTGDFFQLAQRRAPYHYSTIPQDFVLMDDHAPFLKRGIPWVDIIDFDYPYWHTHEDTPDKCSPISLQIIGNVAVEYICGRLKKN
ncbi:MAG: M28 family peptidase [Candidatus Sumerlaeota bacterium]|nr:M28 family peptidase [Candidatus Sumerlaeota bacterium]